MTLLDFKRFLSWPNRSRLITSGMSLIWFYFDSFKELMLYLSMSSLHGKTYHHTVCIAPDRPSILWKYLLLFPKNMLQDKHFGQIKLISVQKKNNFLENVGLSSLSALVLLLNQHDVKLWERMPRWAGPGSFTHPGCWLALAELSTFPNSSALRCREAVTKRVAYVCKAF